MQVMRYVYVLLWLTGGGYASDRDHTGVHLPLFRRSGRFVLHQLSNITQLSEKLSRIEGRYSRSSTEINENKVVRRWQHGSNGADEYLLNGAGNEHTWYTVVQVGEPPQKLEVDVDMLSPDFYTIMTTSGQGVKYDTVSSTTHEPSNEYSHSICHASTEIFHFPHSTSQQSQTRLTFPLCQPGKYTSYTLFNSGTILGLAPPGKHRSLSRVDSPTFLEQLLLESSNLITNNIFSIALLTSTTGILSLSSTIAPQIEETKIRTEKELSYLDRLHLPVEREKMEEEIRGAMTFAIPPGSTHEDHFKWTDVGNNAAAGWHMTLITGIWINGVKVLKNQPALLDVNCPFVLAPVGIAETVYENIPGARKLSSLTEQRITGEESFYAFPCLNEVDIAFELAGWKFPFAKGDLREDAVHGPVGGRFSLGQVDLRTNVSDSDEAVSTGYCVGIIVESSMGIRRESERSAMKDVWILGEPFFRGLGVTFDMGDQEGKGGKIGFRVY